MISVQRAIGTLVAAWTTCNPQKHHEDQADLLHWGQMKILQYTTAELFHRARPVSDTQTGLLRTSVFGDYLLGL